MSNADELAKLKKLLDDGILSPEEFDIQKKIVLSGPEQTKAEYSISAGSGKIGLFRRLVPASLFILTLFLSYSYGDPFIFVIGMIVVVVVAMYISFSGFRLKVQRDSLSK